jgi:hypothetical protein
MRRTFEDELPDGLPLATSYTQTYTNNKSTKKIRKAKITKKAHRFLYWLDGRTDIWDGRY